MPDDPTTSEPPKEDADFERDEFVRNLAKEQHESEGSCEIDDDAEVSYGDDNGAYVQAWVWVDFDGTPYDKEKKDG